MDNPNIYPILASIFELLTNHLSKPDNILSKIRFADTNFKSNYPRPNYPAYQSTHERRNTLEISARATEAIYIIGQLSNLV